MRYIPISSSDGDALSMKVPFWLSQVKNLRKQIHELERLLGKKTMEVEILRKSP